MDLVLSLLAIFVISLLIWRRLRVRETFRHDLSLLEHDAQKKSEELQRELAELREAQSVFQAAQPLAPQSTPTVVPPAPVSTVTVVPPVSPPQNPVPPNQPIPTIFQ